MNQLDPVNYKNGPKNNWRRTAWNLLDSGARTPPRDNLVLYLPGALNLDRAVAVRHGFRPANMIAIEREPAVAKHIRKEHRQSVIEGNLIDVLNAWPDEYPVGTVVADMVTGFDEEASSVLSVWMRRAAFSRSNLLLNVQRGREVSVQYKKVRRKPTDFVDGDLPDAHRARLMMSWLQVALVAEYGPQTNDPVVLNKWLADVVNTGLMRDALRWIVLPSYRSAGAYYDSMIFQDRGKLPRRMESESSDVAMRRKINAALAVRTMRLRGDFQ